jgi:hypothetical protein
MCGAMHRRLRPEGAALLVERSYAGPGRIGHSPIDDASVGAMYPRRLRYVLGRVVLLAQRFGFAVEPVDVARARLDDLMETLTNERTVRLALEHEVDALHEQVDAAWASLAEHQVVLGAVCDEFRAVVQRDPECIAWDEERGVAGLLPAAVAGPVVWQERSGAALLPTAGASTVTWEDER